MLILAFKLGKNKTNSMLNIISKEKFSSISQFSILEGKQVGSGSFGTVKLALHKKTAKMYAVKIIDLSNVPDEGELKLIEREIEIHSEIEHPQIVRLWDTLVEGNMLYMVMEYAENGNLFYYQNHKKVFNEYESYKFFTQTLSTVKYLHSVDIMHRDLKPENLLLDHENNIRVCDFGWATRSITMKRTTFCGTYEYMAPEMLFNSEYDYRVDVWALGILLYELLHGSAPFIGKTIEEVQKSMVKGAYELDATLTSGVKHLISSILQFKQEDRPSIGQILKHPWMVRMQEMIIAYLMQEKVTHPSQISPTLCKMPLSLLKMKSNRKDKSHHKNGSLNLENEIHNINIHLSINNLPCVRKKSKNAMFHSQEKDKVKQITDFKEEYEASKENKEQKDQDRCKTQVDQNVNTKHKFRNEGQKKHMLSNDFDTTNLKRYKKTQNINPGFKSILKFRKEFQSPGSKYHMRYNTETHEKLEKHDRNEKHDKHGDESHDTLKLKKVQAKRVLGSSKNLGKLLKKDKNK